MSARDLPTGCQQRCPLVVPTVRATISDRSERQSPQKQPTRLTTGARRLSDRAGTVTGREMARARVAASIEGFITTPAAPGRKRLKLRPWQREMINGLFDAHGLRGENLQLLARARPSRRRQRLPVQLWGQLLRPCRVLGAATASWSLQRRSSAAMTRGGRARLAARATEIVSTPRLVGIKGPGSVCQHRLGAAYSVQDMRYRETRSHA